MLIHSWTCVGSSSCNVVVDGEDDGGGDVDCACILTN